MKGSRAILWLGWLLSLATVAMARTPTVESARVHSIDGHEMVWAQKTLPMLQLGRVWIWADDSAPRVVQGKLVSSWASGNQVRFVFPDTLFSLQNDGSLKVLHRGQREEQFLLLGRDPSRHQLLRQKSTGRFFTLNEEGGTTAVPLLDRHDQHRVVAWSSPQFPALLVPVQKGHLRHHFYIFSPELDRLEEVGELPREFLLSSFDEDQRGLWLLPLEGQEAWLWDGRSLSSQSVELLKEGQSWKALPIDGGEGLVAEEGKLLRHPSGAELPQRDGSDLPPQQRSTGWQNAAVFAFLILTFAVVMRWRREAEKTQPPLDFSVPAPIHARIIAMVMDVLIIQTPIILIYESFSFPTLTNLPNLGSMESFDLMTDPSFAQAALTMVLIVAFTSTIYHTLMEWFFGCSIGKAFFRIRMVGLEAERPPLRSVLILAAFRSLDVVCVMTVLFPPIFFTSFLRPDRRSVGDRKAGIFYCQVQRP